LWGIALDPFWPLEKNSSASSTSVRLQMAKLRCPPLHAGSDER
jgi:hypothetical protein